MNKIIAVVFDNESNAYEGSKILMDLNANGSITMYSMGVIAKDSSGKVTVKQAPDEGPLGTAFGLMTGSLIGLLGGPAGVAVGAGLGTSAGILWDLASLGVGDDFLAEIGDRLKPGKTAVIAEVEEQWTMPVDTSMEHAGGVVIRRTIEEVEDALIKRDTDALNAEIKQLEAESAQAASESKAKLKKKIDTDKTKLQALNDRTKSMIESRHQKMEAKIKALQEQAVKAKGDTKAKIETRLAEVKADYAERNKKLKHAWELVKQALAA